MLYRDRLKGQGGFTIAELTVVITIAAIVSLIFLTFLNTTFRQYLGLQKDATAFSDLAQQSQRITNVVRGSTDIVSANANDITVYAYFFPNNAYVSLIKYYPDAQNNILYADVTPMTSNPPIGTPITANKKTYKIIPNYYRPAGVNLFEYLDSSGNNLAMPISDLHTIKGIRINLTAQGNGQQNNGVQTVSTQVSLRNRKTNL